MTIFPEFEQQLVELAGGADRSTRRRRLPSAGIVITALASTTALAIAVLAIALLGHTRVADHRQSAHPTRPTVGRGRVPTLAELEANFALLRRHQTAADRATPPPCGHPCTERILPRLTRLARHLPNGDRIVVSVWRLHTPDLGQVAGSYSLHIDVLDGAGKEIVAPDGTGSGTSFTANVHYTVMPFATPATSSGPLWTGLVPDGVTSVGWTFACPSGRPRDRCRQRHSLAPVSARVVVIGNVAAAQVPGTGDADVQTAYVRWPTQADWYTARGYQVASFRNTETLASPPFFTPAVQASPPTHPVVASQLSVFTHAPTSADALPAADRAYLRQEHGPAHPDITDARRVNASDGQNAYLVPAIEGVCVINTNEAFCSPSTSWPGEDVVDLCSPKLPLGQIEIEWLLPDGATDVTLNTPSTTVRPFPPGLNVYIARLPIHGPLPTSIQWDAPGGQHHSVNAGVPPNAQSEKCAHPTGATAHRTAPTGRVAATTVTAVRHVTAHRP